MRRNGIGEAALYLLDEGEYLQAAELFKSECDQLEICPFSSHVDKCVVLCLVPKLIYGSLGVTSSRARESVGAIQEELLNATEIADVNY